MLEESNFHQTQLEYSKAAQLEIPTFLPFGKTSAEVGTMIRDCAAVRAA
jgi:hypothetical protein